LDERRKAFRPTLWYIPRDLVDDPNRPTPELKQVWVRETDIDTVNLTNDFPSSFPVFTPISVVAHKTLSAT
jgi:hypothetical protein